MIDQNEAYTSKTCFECGLLSDPGAGETYKCNHCDNVCGRDVHACFNILTKYMSSRLAATALTTIKIIINLIILVVGDKANTIRGISFYQFFVTVFNL